MMSSNDRMEEIKLLNQFNLESIASGIKVHAHEASPEMVGAAARLFNKGLTDHVDGGYLPDLGIEAANHAQILMRLLSD
jgi:uncharacterized protein (TIGR02647 family)